MAYTVAWGQEAEENYRAIISYLLDSYSFEAANRFTASIDALLCHFDDPADILHKVILSFSPVIFAV